MDTWRRRKGDNNHLQTRSNNRKPPLASWQPTVPAWEKNFCRAVGSVSWGKLMEAKKFMYLFENIIQWNDSAVEEAFNNAKSRYWAEINHLPCDISLPDPDIHIDEIDWDVEVDPELLLDLERDAEPLDETDKEENGVILTSSFLKNSEAVWLTGWGPEWSDAEEDVNRNAKRCDQYVVLKPTGWGDDEEDVNKNAEKCDQNVVVKASGWGDAEEDVKKNTEDYNLNSKDDSPWCEISDPSKGAMEGNGWGNNWNDSWKEKGWGNNWNDCWEWNGWDSHCEESNNVGYRAGGDQGTWNGNRRKREGSSWYPSKYKTSRHPGEYRGWRSGRGRKTGLTCN